MRKLLVGHASIRRRRDRGRGTAAGGAARGRGLQVTATISSRGKSGLLDQLGADAVVMDGLDAVSVGEAVAEARPDAIVHEVTAMAGKPDMKHMKGLQGELELACVRLMPQLR